MTHAKDSNRHEQSAKNIIVFFHAIAFESHKHNDAKRTGDNKINSVNR